MQVCTHGSTPALLDTFVLRLLCGMELLLLVFFWVFFVLGFFFWAGKIWRIYQHQAKEVPVQLNADRERKQSGESDPTGRWNEYGCSWLACCFLKCFPDLVPCGRTWAGLLLDSRLCFLRRRSVNWGVIHRGGSSWCWWDPQLLLWFTEWPDWQRRAWGGAFEKARASLVHTFAGCTSL